MPYLAQRWQEGCQNINKLYDEVVAQGFMGNYMSVYRAMKKLQKDGMIVNAVAPVSIPIPNLSVTTATWLLVHADDRLDDGQRRLRDTLCQSSQDIKLAYSLVQSFCTLLRERQADQLDGWLDKAEQCGIDAFRNFAAGLRKDYAAVKAALIYEWSQGQVEGQVNRLKFIKRQMYGRANFDLLRKKVVGAPRLC
jgi:transposase